MFKKTTAYHIFYKHDTPEIQIFIVFFFYIEIQDRLFLIFSFDNYKQILGLICTYRNANEEIRNMFNTAIGPHDDLFNNVI